MNGWLEQTAAYWGAGGPLLAPIALVSLGIWGLFLRSRDVLVRTLRDGAAARAVLDSESRGKTAGPLAAALESVPGGIAALVRGAIDDVGRGAAPRAAFAARESEALGLLRRDLVVLSALTAVAPLLGLLGTVAGMIHTFDAVAVVGGNTGARVAEGVSQALITTQFGLVVALPGVFGVSRLQRMLRNVQAVMAECRSHALQVLAPAAEG